MSLKIIDNRGRITLSKDIRKQAGLEIGDIIKVIASPQVITLRKVSIVDVTLDDVKSDITSSLRHSQIAIATCPLFQNKSLSHL